MALATQHTSSVPPEVRGSKNNNVGKHLAHINMKFFNAIGLGGVGVLVLVSHTGCFIPKNHDNLFYLVGHGFYMKVTITMTNI